MPHPQRFGGYLWFRAKGRAHVSWRSPRAIQKPVSDARESRKTSVRHSRVRARASKSRVGFLRVCARVMGFCKGVGTGHHVAPIDSNAGRLAAPPDLLAVAASRWVLRGKVMPPLTRARYGVLLYNEKRHVLHEVLRGWVILLGMGYWYDAPTGTMRRTSKPTRVPKKERPLCGARCRSGRPCRSRVVVDGGRLRHRCRLHGGLSTGPKTAEGRARIAAAQRSRWASWLARIGTP